jgi:hypothetical protein
MATEKPRATAQEINSIINNYGENEDFLKECWKICAKNNLILPYELYFDLDDEYYTESDSCKELKKDGVKWKWLPSDILQILPTMAEPYLNRPLNRISDIPLEEEIVIEDDNSNEQNDIHEEIETNADVGENEYDVEKELSWEEKIIDKINHGISLSEDEMKELVFDGYSVHTDYDENRRWTRTVDDVILLKDKNDNKYFYSISWEEGLTESQENEFYNQPIRVYPYEKVTINKEELFTNDKLVADNFNDKKVSLEFVKDILDGEGINMDIETGDIVTDEYKKINTDATSDDWGDMDESVEVTREVDDDFDMEL